MLRSQGETFSGHAAELDYHLLQWLYSKGLPVPESLSADTSGAFSPDPCLLIVFAPGKIHVPGLKGGALREPLLQEP